MNTLSQKATKLFALASPVMAAGGKLYLNSGTNSTFKPLETVTVNSILSGAISLVLVVVTVVFFFILVLGGLKWITSGGDEKKLATAKGQITNALIGLAIVFASWAILNLIQTIFGVDILTNGLSIPSFNSTTLNINDPPAYQDVLNYK